MQVSLVVASLTSDHDISAYGDSGQLKNPESTSRRVPALAAVITVTTHIAYSITRNNTIYMLQLLNFSNLALKIFQVWSFHPCAQLVIFPKCTVC